MAAAFGYYRNQDLEAIDYFSNPANGGNGKPPFSREQYGGSIGGPIIKDKAFFFGSVERISQDYNLPRAGSVIQQLNYLVPLNIGVKVTPSIPEPISNLLPEAKVSYLFNTQHFMPSSAMPEENYHTQNFIDAARPPRQLIFCPTRAESLYHMNNIRSSARRR